MTSLTEMAPLPSVEPPRQPVVLRALVQAHVRVRLRPLV